jgi:raffinose/stachyose/melibiose transport system permease protein
MGTTTLDYKTVDKAAVQVRKPLIRGPQVTAIIYLIPAVTVFLVFVIWPIIQSARYSLFVWDGIGPLTEYVGLNNYNRLLNDPIFWKALGNNIFVVAWSLITQIPLAIGLAILLTGSVKGSAFFRTLYFAPLVLSDVLVGALWNWVYNPTIGLANTMLRGMGAPTQGWLGDPRLALVCVMVASTWKYLGFYIVIFIAAIQTIPEELYEAAKIDGANSFQLHRFITLPLISPAARTSALLIIVGSMKFFDLIWSLTEGGPSNSSELIATYMFKQAFRSKDWSYGSTLAFGLFVIAFIFALIFLFVTRRREKYA